MLAFTGPTSMHCAPSGAMKRASDVPPPVLSSGSPPANFDSTSRAVERSRPSGVKNGSPLRCHDTLKSRPAFEQRLDPGLQFSRRPVRVETQVEHHLQLARDDVARARAGLDVGIG